MILKQKSLTQRASELSKTGGTSAELTSVMREITTRIDQVDAEQITKRHEIDNASDLDQLRIAKQIQVDLKDEELVLRRLSSDIYQARQKALGLEAMASSAKLKKELASALQEATKAQEIIAECQRKAASSIAARRAAADIGEVLLFDSNVIQALAATIFPDGNERKQLMIDLGIAESRRAQRA
jgi:hypothetical protein